MSAIKKMSKVITHRQVAMSEVKEVTIQRSMEWGGEKVGEVQVK